MLELDTFEKEKAFIEKIEKSYQMKKYNNLLLNFLKTESQFPNLLESYTNILLNLANKKNLNIIIRLKSWWYDKKIDLLKTKKKLAQEKLRLIENKIYFEILSLYFNSNNLNDKVLYQFEYDKWATKVIQYVSIKNSNLKDLISTLFGDVSRIKTFQIETGLKVENPENLLIENFIYETINSEELLNFQAIVINLFENYEQLLILQKNILKIQKLNQLFEKNQLKLKKLKKSWFFKNLRCMIIKLKMEVLKREIKIITKNNGFFYEEIINLYDKNEKIKTIENNLFSKILNFLTHEINNKVTKKNFMIKYKKIMKNLTHNPCKLAIINKFTEKLFDNVLTNINESQSKDRIKVEDINNNIMFFNEDTNKSVVSLSQ